MANFLQLQKRAKNLTSQRVKADFYDFLRSLENELAQYNKSQLFIGSKDISGEPIGTYSKRTQEITKGRKKAGQKFDLFEKGYFLGGFFAKLQGDFVQFGTTDGKKEKVLTNLLTTDIFGLDKDNKIRVVKEKLLPFFQNYYKNKLINEQ